MDERAAFFGDAAHAAAEATAEAIDHAADANDDPVVAEALEEASIRADTAKSRTAWIRSWLRRTFGLAPVDDELC